MRRLLALVMTFALTAAACGGGSGDSGSDDGDSDDTTPATSTQPGDGEGDPAPTTTLETGGDGNEGPAPDASLGILTVAGETYHFADTGRAGLQCLPSSFNVAFLVALGWVDENGEALEGSLVMGIPFKGEEETAGIMPEIDASVGDLEWVANPEHVDDNVIPSGSSQVDSYEIDGNTVSGTATFYERSSSFGQGDLIVEEGEFEVTCVEE